MKMGRTDGLTTTLPALQQGLLHCPILDSNAVILAISDDISIATRTASLFSVRNSG
jgi:hypothetical protein